MIKLIDLSRDKTKGVRTIEATFMKNGELIPLRVSEEDNPKNFIHINSILNQTDVDVEEIGEELYTLMSPAAKVEVAIDSSYYLSGNLSIENGTLKFGDHLLEDTLSTHMLSLLDETTNTPKDEKIWKSYVRFLDNMYQNVNEKIRTQLFRWMDYENRAGNGFGITEDGCIVGYKGCQGSIIEPYSAFQGNAIVNGEEMKGHIPNKVGSVIQMPRSEVQFDPSVGCSTGLHVGTRDYAVNWAPILLLVKVNPRDVVSVPFECDSQKMRVCEYTVLKVTDASEEHEMLHFYEDDEDDYDYDYDYDEYDECDCDDCDEYDCDEYDCCDDDDCDDCKCELVDCDCGCYCDDCDCIADCDDCDCDDCKYETESCDEDFEDDYEDDDCGETMSVRQAAQLLNKELYIEYDDKDFTGIVGEVYIDSNNSGIILRNEYNEYKHIKLYRITYWEILGDFNDYEDDYEEEEELNEFDQFINDIKGILEAVEDDEDFIAPF